MTPTLRTVSVRTAGGRDLDVDLAFPEDGPGRHAGVVVVHEIFGVDAHVRDVARRFAAQGYVAAAPNLFTGEIQATLTPANIARVMPALASAPPELRRNPTRFAEFAATQPEEFRPILAAFARVSNPATQEGFALELRAVAEDLRHRPEVDPARIGSVGFCFGGAMSGRLATVDPLLAAAVIFYGQNPPLADVPRIRARVLGLYGAEDPGITATVPELADAMAKAGVPFASHVYPGARHAFFNDTRPNYDRASAEDAWQRVLTFFSVALGPAPSR